MDEKHVKLVRGTIRQLQEGQQSTFYMAVEKERRVLHIHRKKAPPSRFDSVSKINQHLGAKGLGEPLGKTARVLAGTVELSGSALFFQTVVKRGAGKRELRRVLCALRRLLLLPPTRLGTPESSESSYEPTFTPAEQTAKQAQRLQTIEDARALMLEDPDALDTAALEQLMRRAEHYIEDGGEVDVSDVAELAVLLWEERVSTEEVARHEAIMQAAEGVIQQVLSGDSQTTQELAKRLHAFWLESAESEDFSVLPEKVQDAALDLAVVYARVQPAYQAIAVLLQQDDVNREEELALLTVLRDELQCAIDTVHITVGVV